MVKRILFGVFLLQLLQRTYCGYRDDEQEYVFLERFSQFHCYKHSTCTPGGEQVCGHDQANAVLAYFKDICLMHLANCKRAGVYSQVELIVCKAKYNYTVKFKDELQFVPIKRPTVTPVPNLTDSVINDNPRNAGNVKSHLKIHPGKGDTSKGQSSCKSYLKDSFIKMVNKKHYKPKLTRLLDGRKK